MITRVRERPFDFYGRGFFEEENIVRTRLCKKKMKKVNKQCLLDTPRTVRVSEKTWQVIVGTRRP